MKPLAPGCRFALVAAWLLPLTAGAWDYRTEGLPAIRRQESADFGIGSGIRVFAGLPNGDVLLGADGVYAARTAGQIQRIPATEGQPIRLLAVGDDRRIWIVSTRDAGWLAPDETGEYRFYSLRRNSPNSDGISPRDIVAIQPTANGAVFIGNTGATVWDGKQFGYRALPGSGRLQPLHPAPGVTWAYRPNAGLLSFGDAGPRLLRPESRLPDALLWILPPTASIRGALPSLDRDGWLAGTKAGAYRLVGGQWLPLVELSSTLGNSIVTAAVRLEAGTFAVSTQNQGVFVVSDDGAVLSHLDRDNALADNQVQAMWNDARGDMWVGTATGWTRLTPPQRLSIFPTGNPRVSDAVRAIQQVGDRIYVATVQGVHEVAPGARPGDFASLSALPPAPGPVWTLARIGSSLFAGGSRGLWLWTGNAWITAFESKDDVLTTLFCRKGPGRLVFNDGRKLLALRRAGDAWETDVLYDEMAEAPSSLLEDADGDIWVCTASSGIFRYRFLEQPGRPPVLEEKAHYSLGPGTASGPQPPLLAMVGGDVCLLSDAGIAAFDARGQRFEPLAGFPNVRGIASCDSGQSGVAIWLVESREPNQAHYPALIRVRHDSGGPWNWEPLSPESLSFAGRLSSGALVRQVSASGSALWIGASRGLLRIGGDELKPADPPPAVTIAKLIAYGPPKPRVPGSPPSAPAPSVRIPLNAPTSPPANSQTLAAELATTNPRPTEFSFQVRLKGLSDDWTYTNSVAYRDFVGLPSRHYELQIRAVDRFGRSGRIISYGFDKAPPWYFRLPVLAGYVLLLALVVWLGYTWRLRHLRRRNDQLNSLVEERTNELAMANAAKMDFLASIAHEVRNPLNGVIGMANLLLESGALADSNAQVARSLASCSRSLRRVFDEVLGFARLEQGQVPLRNRPFRVRDLLEDVVGVFAMEAAQRATVISIRIENLDSTLSGDDEKIRTIVSNFIANALKYAAGSPITIEADAEPVSNDRRRVTIQVRDEGPGIPAEEQPLIFRKFVRGTGAAASRETGAGLGLATCRALAQLLGGQVGVESPPAPKGVGHRQRGSVFYLQLTLPVTYAQPASPASSGPESFPPATRKPAGSPAEHANSSQERALVVEDQEYNQLVAVSIAARLGYSTDVAADGASARRRLKECAYSLILLDWDVPGAKGDELARLIRAQPGGREPIIVAVTAHDGDDVRSLCLEAGMDAVLIKPLEESVLKQLIRDVRANAQHAPPVDFQIFNYLGKGDPEKSQAALLSYLAQLNQEVEALRQALRSQDRHAVARAAHRLRAHASVVQFRPLNNVARILQESASGPDDYRGAGDETIRQAAALDAQLRRIHAGASREAPATS